MWSASLALHEQLRDMRQKLGQMHHAARLLRLGGRDDLVDLLLGGHAAQQTQHGTDFTHIDQFIAVMIEYTESIRDALLQIVVNYSY